MGSGEPERAKMAAKLPIFASTLKYYIHVFTTVASDQKLGNRKECVLNPHHISSFT